MELIPEVASTDLMSWELGPYHDVVPGPFRLRLTIDGELIVGCQVETGFVHRGLEKIMEGQNWSALTAYAGRLDPENSVFGELAICLATEEIADIEVPNRAKMIRVILCELYRLSSHLKYMALMAKAVEAQTAVHYILRDRERVLDLFELIAGARFSLNFLRIGGVAHDITEGFIERVLDVCELVQLRVKEYNDLLTFNRAFLRRTAYVGVLHSKGVEKYGVSGPNARASGVQRDIRKVYPYAQYDHMDFSVPVGRGEYGAPGDCHDRFLIRIREIIQSIEIIRQTIEVIPEGPFKAEEKPVPKGEAYVRVESPRGATSCLVASSGGRTPDRVHFRGASQASLAAFPSMICSAKISDLAVVLASLDISVAEIDR